MEVKGEWRASTSGGGISGSAWRNNPQYLLSDLKEGDSCTLTLKLSEGSKKSKDSPPSTPVGFALFKHADGYFL